jgi:hypothetical protein
MNTVSSINQMRAYNIIRTRWLFGCIGGARAAQPTSGGLSSTSLRLLSSSLNPKLIAVDASEAISSADSDSDDEVWDDDTREQRSVLASCAQVDTTTSLAVAVDTSRVDLRKPRVVLTGRAGDVAWSMTRCVWALRGEQ